jgi:hypothetical protein
VIVSVVTGDMPWTISLLSSAPPFRCGFGNESQAQYHPINRTSAYAIEESVAQHV